MAGKALSGWALVVGAGAMSVALVTAFNAAETGARTVTVNVVTDADAYLALAEYASGAHNGFVSLDAGKVQFTFDGNNVDAAGAGVNPGSAYEFDSLVTVTNKGTQATNVDVTFGGTDASLCQAVLTSGADQTAATYSADPAPLALAKGATAYLGVKVLATGKASGGTVACTVAVTAS